MQVTKLSSTENINTNNYILQSVFNGTVIVILSDTLLKLVHV